MKYMERPKRKSAKEIVGHQINRTIKALEDPRLPAFRIVEFRHHLGALIETSTLMGWKPHVERIKGWVRANPLIRPLTHGGDEVNPGITTPTQEV